MLILCRVLACTTHSTQTPTVVHLATSVPGRESLPRRFGSAFQMCTVLFDAPPAAACQHRHAPRCCCLLRLLLLLLLPDLVRVHPPHGYHPIHKLLSMYIQHLSVSPKWSTAVPASGSCGFQVLLCPSLPVHLSGAHAKTEACSSRLFSTCRPFLPHTPRCSPPRPRPLAEAHLPWQVCGGREGPHSERYVRAGGGLHVGDNPRSWGHHPSSHWLPPSSLQGGPPSRQLKALQE